MRTPIRAAPDSVVRWVSRIGWLRWLDVPPVRIRWRPITGWIGLAVSRRLRPGDRAWYIGARDATLVLVTARHGIRIVIARPGLGENESMSVRRTRVFVLPVDAD